MLPFGPGSGTLIPQVLDCFDSILDFGNFPNQFWPRFLKPKAVLPLTIQKAIPPHERTKEGFHLGVLSPECFGLILREQEISLVKKRASFAHLGNGAYRPLPVGQNDIGRVNQIWVDVIRSNEVRVGLGSLIIKNPFFCYIP